MIIGKYIPHNAIQVRYIHPYYEEDEDGYRFMANEDEATNVWQLIHKVNRTQQPMYFRRRTSEYAKHDVRRYNRDINDANRNNTDFKDWYHVRCKKVGRRVLFVHDEVYWMKVYARYKSNVPRDLHVLDNPRLTRSNVTHRTSDYVDRAWQALEDQWEFEREMYEQED